MAERPLFLRRAEQPSRHDAASEILLLAHESVRWDLEEMARHLQEPHFTGQPQKVHIFFRWFELCFCELVKMSHARTDRLLANLAMRPAYATEAERDEEAARPLNPSAASGSPSFLPAASPAEQEALRRIGSRDQEEQLLRERRAARVLMGDVLGCKEPLLRAQPDDRSNFAEDLRVKVSELGGVLAQCMALEEEFLLPHVRHTTDPEDARAVLDAEMQGEMPPMGWLGLSMWLPWVIHAMDRWCTPVEVAAFRDRLPWHIAGLVGYLWEPLYMSTNWGLLQSMADPVEGEGDASQDDGAEGVF